MEVAEQLLHQEAPKKGLGVWRGSCPGFFFPYETPQHIIVVGLLTSQDLPSPALAALAIRLEIGGVTFRTDSQLSLCPFGGGWNPYDKLRDFIGELPDCR